MKKIFLLLFLAAIAQSLTAQTAPKTYEYRNGSWYNGKDFTPGTWYVVGGRLTKKAPAKIDSIVDLLDRWVVPPSADVFCSSVAGNSAASTTLKLYFEEGAFYLQILGNTTEGRAAVEGLVNKSTSPDATFGNGGLTCTLGYPFLKYEGPAQGIRNPQLWGTKYDQIKTGTKMLGNGYWFIDSKDALNKNWDKIKAQKPQVISIYLLDAQKNGGKEGKGLSAEVAKLVVKKAHKSDLRVYAHVENEDDVQLALKLGVDGFANLPGHDWDGSGDVKKYELSDDDLKKMAKKKVPVAACFSHGQNATAPAVQAFHLATIKRLLDNDVNLVLGSDDSQRSGRVELSYWFNLGGLDYGKLLKVLCENSPRAVFPDRKIGKIDEGFEASFVVLNDNPLTNILKLRAVSVKVKNGILTK
jgi:hypothetical protein